MRLDLLDGGTRTRLVDPTWCHGPHGSQVEVDHSCRGIRSVQMHCEVVAGCGLVAATVRGSQRDRELSETPPWRSALPQLIGGVRRLGPDGGMNCFSHLNILETRVEVSQVREVAVNQESNTIMALA